MHRNLRASNLIVKYKSACCLILYLNPFSIDFKMGIKWPSFCYRG